MYKRYDNKNDRLIKIYGVAQLHALAIVMEFNTYCVKQWECDSTAVGLVIFCKISYKELKYNK